MPERRRDGNDQPEPPLHRGNDGEPTVPTRGGRCLPERRPRPRLCPRHRRPAWARRRPYNGGVGGGPGPPSSSATSGAERLESASATKRELNAIVVACPSTVASIRPVLSPTSAAFAVMTSGGSLDGST